MSSDKLPPQNIEAEQSVLGGLLIAPEAIVAVATLLRPEDFYRESHGQVYEAILRLYERRVPADFVTVCDELERSGRLKEVGGASYLTSLINACPTSAHVEYYGHIVDRTALLRRLISAAGKIAGLAYREEGEVSDIVSQAMDLIAQVGLQAPETRPILSPQERASKAFDALEAAQKSGPPGIPFGFATLDRLFGGMRQKAVTTVCGAAKVGKSSFVQAVVRNAERLGYTVLYFSLEMSDELITQREIASRLHLPAEKLYIGNLSDDELEQVTNVLGVIGAGSVFTVPYMMTPSLLRKYVERQKARHGLDLVVIDYLQLINVPGKDGVEAIDEASRMEVEIASDFNVPVLSVAQLSRKLFSTDDYRPRIYMLRGSGRIEQDAGMVIGLHRFDLWKDERPRSEAEFENWFCSHSGIPWERAAPTQKPPLPPDTVMETTMLANRFGPQYPDPGAPRVYVGWGVRGPTVFDPFSVMDEREVAPF